VASVAYAAPAANANPIAAAIHFTQTRWLIVLLLISTVLKNLLPWQHMPRPEARILTHRMNRAFVSAQPSRSSWKAG
jgi:hypothetical protein